MDAVKAATLGEFKKLIDILKDNGAENPQPDNEGISLSHIYWMCLHAVENISIWPIDKSSRWLGYVQSNLIMRDKITMLELREGSRESFHTAYKENGLPIPPSSGADTVAVNN